MLFGHQVGGMSIQRHRSGGRRLGAQTGQAMLRVINLRDFGMMREGQVVKYKDGWTYAYKLELGGNLGPPIALAVERHVMCCSKTPIPLSQNTAELIASDAIEGDGVAGFDAPLHDLVTSRRIAQPAQPFSKPAPQQPEAHAAPHGGPKKGNCKGELLGIAAPPTSEQPGGRAADAHAGAMLTSDSGP
eukprot:3585648-Pyramimonas_sp.AAC.1